jgi:hypothetical protein
MARSDASFSIAARTPRSKGWHRPCVGGLAMITSLDVVAVVATVLIVLSAAVGLGYAVIALVPIVLPLIGQ